jgi:hypothetical protein
MLILPWSRGWEGAVHVGGERGADDAHDRLPDPGSGLSGIGLPRIKPGDDRLDGHHRRQLCRPPRQPLIRYERRDLQECGGGDVGAELLDALLELRLAQGVLEQQPEPGRGFHRRFEKAVDAGVGEPAHGLRHVGIEADAHAVKDGLVQVGLRVEVPVEDHPGDAGLGGDVLQARRREAAAGKGFGGGAEDLFPSLSARQAADRLRPVQDHDRSL